MAAALAESLGKPFPWAVGFFFGNTELSMEIWNIMGSYQGLIIDGENLKFIALLAVFIGIILVGCSSGAQTTVEQPSDTDALVAAAVAAGDVREKVPATLSASAPTTAPPPPTTESGSTVREVVEKALPPLYSDHVYSGEEYQKEGQYENAIHAYDKAIQLAPNDAMPYNNRGGVYYALGQYQRAIEDYTEAIQLDPEDALAYYNRGYAYSLLGQDTKAEAAVAKACSLDSLFCR